MLEIDITSYSDVQDYLPYGVPEVWLFRNEKLSIYQLLGDAYIVEPESQYFPGMDVSAMVTRCLTVAYERNTSAAIRELRRVLVGS